MTMTDDDIPDEIRCVTTRAVSEMTGIQQATLRAWRARGQGPASFNAHGVVLYRVAEVTRWLAEAEAKTGGRYSR